MYFTWFYLLICFGFLVNYTLSATRFDQHTRTTLHIHLDTPANHYHSWVIACYVTRYCYTIRLWCSLIATAILELRQPLNGRFLYSDCFLCLCASMPYVLLLLMCPYVLTCSATMCLCDYMCSCALYKVALGVSLDLVRLNRNSVLNPWRCLLQTLSSFGSHTVRLARCNHEDKRIAALVSRQMAKSRKSSAN
ncbi:hypothetical protein Hanom_Chr06g00545361 [Helianthus anomalus]